MGTFSHTHGLVVLENESASTTFAPGSPAPYLSQTLTSQGAFVPNYYGIGHASLDNYIAMIGGQPAEPDDPGRLHGCVRQRQPGHLRFVWRLERDRLPVHPRRPDDRWPADNCRLYVGRIHGQQGSDPGRESSTCAFPTVGTTDPSVNKETAPIFDEYATRHDPFVYYRSITDDTDSCRSQVANLRALPQALASVVTTPNYVFITPGVCNDGHDTTGCPGGSGLVQADSFLRTWVPQITASPAYKQDGLLLSTFDEGVSDNAPAAVSCLGRRPQTPAGDPAAATSAR